MKDDDDDGTVNDAATILAATISILPDTSGPSTRTIKPRHHVLGVEDCIGTRFWAGDGDSESSHDEDEEDAGTEGTDMTSVHTMDTEDFVRRARDVDFTESDLRQAEEEVQVSPMSKQYIAPAGTLAKQVIDKIVATKKKPQLWYGRLPKPRVSPPRTFGDAIANAKVSSQPSSLNLRSRLPSLFHR
jgi:hypothetical protein